MIISRFWVRPPAEPWRLAALAFVALSVSLPMAWVSLGKAVLLLAVLAHAALAHFKPPSPDSQARPFRTFWGVWASAGALATWSLSLLWTEVDWAQALHAWGKHAKLIEVGLCLVLVRTRAQALWALKWFLLGQAFFVLNAWLLVAGVNLPWASARRLSAPRLIYSVYSTYLDQTLIFAGAAAVAWHLRARWGAWQRWAVAGATAALAHNLLAQPGRTGWLVSLAVLGLALFWALPQRLRWPALLLTPALLAAALWLGSARFQAGLQVAWQEGQQYSQAGKTDTSLGFRLHAWRRSVQAWAERPWLGHGVGSWTASVKRLEGPQAESIFGSSGSNPHQEYLLWAVSLGASGPLLLLGWMLAWVRDAARAAPDVARAVTSLVLALALACAFNSSLYDALVGDFFVVTLGLLLALARFDAPSAAP